MAAASSTTLLLLLSLALLCTATSTTEMATVTAADGDDADEGCAPGWVGGPDVGACFLLESRWGNFSWRGAVAHCAEAPGADAGASFLAEPKTWLQHSFLLRRLGRAGFGGAWVGAGDVRREGRWRWAGGGNVRAEAAFWEAGVAPGKDDRSMNCLKYPALAFGWAPADCSEPLRPICQYDLPGNVTDTPPPACETPPEPPCEVADSSAWQVTNCNSHNVTDSGIILDVARGVAGGEVPVCVAARAAGGSNGDGYNVSAVVTRLVPSASMPSKDVAGVAYNYLDAVNYDFVYVRVQGNSVYFRCAEMKWGKFRDTKSFRPRDASFDPDLPNLLAVSVSEEAGSAAAVFFVNGAKVAECPPSFSPVASAGVVAFAAAGFAYEFDDFDLTTAL